jgi:hypothetical protein
MKKNVWSYLLVSFLVVLGLPSISVAVESQAVETLGKLPLFFVENKGQADTSLQFYSYGGQMYFSPEGIYTHFIQRDSTYQNRFRDKFHEIESISHDTTPVHEKHLVLKKRFLNANTQCEIVGEEELPGKLNYFIGNDSTKWHTNLRTFKQIRYRNLYPGVDLVYHGNQGPTEYDLVINPAAHNSVSSPLSQIQFTIEGADKLELSPEGDLLVYTSIGILKEKSPISYQMKNGIKQTLNSHFTLTSNNTFSFAVPDYDKTQSLVIDPLIYSTFLGGHDTYREWPKDIAVDSIGNCYVTGFESSNNFPITPGSFDTTYNGIDIYSGDVVITKLNASGSALIYSTYLGGSYYDLVGHLAIDQYCNVYVAGYTRSSTDFPTTPAAYDRTFNGGLNDAFITKLNSTGSSLIYSTYLGGTFQEFYSSNDFNYDCDCGIALDSIGNLYIAGYTDSIDFPTTFGAYDTSYYTTLYGCSFIAKLDANGSNLLFSTYLGSIYGTDKICDITLDPSGNIIVAGTVIGSNFPTTANAYDTTYNGGYTDCFVTKFNPSCSALIYSTFLGGDNYDKAVCLAADSEGNVYIAGYTRSTTFPITLGALDTTYNGYSKGFLSKLNSSGSILDYSTFFSGFIYDIAVDNAGQIYMTGSANSIFPTTIGAYDTTFNSEAEGYADCFISKINPSGSRLDYSTYLGGNLSDWGGCLALDKSYNVYIFGYTESSADFPITATAFDKFYNGGQDDFFVTKLSIVITPDLKYLPNLKMLANESLSNIFDLEDYNEGYRGENYSILINFFDLTSLSASIVSQGAYSGVTSGLNSFIVSNSYGTCTASNTVKYSTYRLNKLSWVGIRAGEKVVLNLSNYCYSTAGRVIPPSFGSVSALVVSDTTLLSARWIDSSNIEISALSGFTAAGWIDIIASPVTSNFGIDIDKERIYVHPNLLNIGKFTTFNDIWNYGLEKTTDKADYPAISFLTTANDGSGASQSNVMCFDFTSTNQGIKMTPQFSRMFQYEANSWYIARMKVCSPTVNNDLESQLYHYNGIIPDNAHIDISANIYFGTPTTWSWIETPLYATTTGTGYPQLMLKAGDKTGKLYIAEVQVFKAVPTLYNSTRSKHTLGYAYSNFSSLDYLAMGWSTTECFDTGTSKPALSVTNPGVLSVNFNNAPSDGKSMKFSAWNGNTQKIYTPASTPSSEIGMKADINIASGSFDSYDAMVFLGCYGVATNGSYDFTSIGGQLAAMAEFGTITDGTHYLAAPGRNGYHQMQFALKNNEDGVLNIQNVDFLRDTDDSYFGDITLFP